jgi:membrane associated rhomboid family serine protease
VQITVSIALLILVTTIGVSLLALYAAPQLIDRLIFRPYYVKRRGELHTWITHGFVHGDLMHLIFNMMTFWFFAFMLERRIGGIAFAALYFGSLVLAVSTTYFKHRNDPQYATLGASGAIAAVLFAAIVYFPTMSLFIIPIPVPIPAPLFAVAYVAYSWYATGGGKLSGGPGGRRLNHDAHLLGAVLGLVFVLLTDPGAYRDLLRVVLG